MSRPMSRPTRVVIRRGRRTIPLDRAASTRSTTSTYRSATATWLCSRQPQREGQARGGLHVRADGVPTSVAAGTGSTLTDASLLECIANASGLGLGPPKEEGMTLRYTFNLAPAGHAPLQAGSPQDLFAATTGTGSACRELCVRGALRPPERGCVIVRVEHHLELVTRMR
jgi:hypothetical protein